MDNRELCDDAMHIIDKYIEEHYSESIIKNQSSIRFKNMCYVRWTAFEIIERLNVEIERLPQYLTGDWREPTSPIEVISEFISDIENYTHQHSSKKKDQVFNVARDVAIDLLLLFL